MSGVDVGKSTDVSGVPQCTTDFSGVPGGKAKFVVIHPEDEMLRMDGFISKSDGIGALLSKITEFRQIDPASPTSRFVRFTLAAEVQFKNAVKVTAP